MFSVRFGSSFLAQEGVLHETVLSIPEIMSQILRSCPQFEVMLSILKSCSQFLKSCSQIHEIMFSHPLSLPLPSSLSLYLSLSPLHSPLSLSLLSLPLPSPLPLYLSLSLSPLRSSRTLLLVFVGAYMLPSQKTIMNHVCSCKQKEGKAKRPITKETKTQTHANKTRRAAHDNRTMENNGWCSVHVIRGKKHEPAYYCWLQHGNGEHELPGESRTPHVLLLSACVSVLFCMLSLFVCLLIC